MTTTSDIISKYQKSSEIAEDIVSLGNDLGVDPMFVADLIYFESKFDPAATNLAGSGATGLIQFMPSRAEALGTTTEKLAKMTAKEQMEYVKKYFSADNLGAGNLKKLRDNPTRHNLNMAVFYPKGIGQDPSTELPREFQAQNRGMKILGDYTTKQMEQLSEVDPGGTFPEPISPGMGEDRTPALPPSLRDNMQPVSSEDITGGAAEDSLDAQMAEAMGSIPVETDPSRYRTVPEEKLTEGEPLNSRELLESPTQQEVRPAYTEEESDREAYVDPNSERRQRAYMEGTGAFAPESTGDQTIGDMLRSFFGTNEEADTYEGPTGEADPANFAHGGPVEKELEVTEDDLPDPPPGATPEEVADDIPAYLSTGEYVLPANVVRYYGLSRISDLHKNALFELQQMEDLGIIQNVDHNGKEEDDDDEMDFIQEPETLVVVESSKGLMRPMHFERGGTDKGDENDQSETDDGPSMAEQADADQTSDPAETGTAEAAAAAAAAAAAQDMADLEKEVAQPGLFGTGLTAEKAFGFTSIGRIMKGIGEFAEGLTQAYQGLEEAGYTVDFPGEEGYSGFGKGKDIGGDDGSRGGGGDDLDNLMAEETSNLPKIRTSVRRYTPGVGIRDKSDYGLMEKVRITDTAPKRGIMRAAEGGLAYVPGVGLLGTGQNVFEETASELELPSLSFDKFTADVFGFGKVPNVDTLGPKKAVEEFTKNKFEEYKTKPPLTGADLQTRVKSAKEFTPRSVLGTDGQGPSASNEYAKDKELRRILSNRGVDGQDFADVINNYRAGQRQILPNSHPLSNEQLISELDALSNSRRVTREGVTSSDIPEGATNRDVLKGIFAPQISSLEQDDSRNRRRTGKEDRIEAIVTSDSLGEKYGYNLNDPADPDTLNKIVNFANSGTYSPDYTPKSKGLMSASPTSQPPEGAFIPGVGLI